MLALVPAFGPSAIRSSLRGITVPVTIVGLPADELAPFELNARRYQRLIPRARLVTVADAGHFVLMPTCTFAGRLVASEVCVDRRDGVNRAAVHAEVAAKAVAFFDRSLKVARPRRAERERSGPASGRARPLAAATR
ncbi:MAG: hypothetical protein IT293_19020 [Deltaproteobacteria bacterium]|nr:hypothetical protein [Deltaproteobacteria bacterium]